MVSTRASFSVPCPPERLGVWETGGCLHLTPRGALDLAADGGEPGPVGL